MKQSVIKRVSELIERRGVTPRGFASEIDFNYSTLNNYLTGRRKAIDVSLIESIVSSFGNVSAEWLITGNGTMLKDESLLYGVAQEKKGAWTRPRIPMSVAAGSVGGFADSVKLYDCEQIPVIEAFPAYDYTMIVKGDSMEPKFEGGDEIAIKKVTDYIEWGKVYVLDTRDGAVIKRLYDAQEKYRCVSYNKDYPDFEVNKADVFGVYKVVGLIRI
jgi:repressor LexA